MVTTKRLAISGNNRAPARKTLPVGGDVARVEAPSVVLADEVIDGEPLDDETTSRNSGSAQGEHDHTSWRQYSRERMRDYFNRNIHDEAAAGERAREETRRRAEQADDPTASEREELLQLRAKIRQAGETYLQSLHDSNVLVPGFSEPEPVKQIDAMQQVYVRMMLQACIRPLSKGVNASSIVQAIGMYSAMRMMSSDFRSETSGQFGPLTKVINDKIDRRTYKIGTEAIKASEVHNRGIDAETKAQIAADPSLADDPEFMAAQQAKKKQPGDHVAWQWRERFEKMMHADRGHREMFTPESAAMTEVALMENAYWKMRDPYNDGDAIAANYKTLINRLRGQMAEDGLSREDVVSHARMLIGKRLETEPELRSMFKGMAHGRVVKSAEQPVRVAGTDKVQMMWTGDFEDQLGNKLPDSGMLLLRPPMQPDEHQAQLSETMHNSLVGGLNMGDRDGFRSSIAGYMVGFAAKKQQLDYSGMPSLMRQRLEQSEVMLASMESDGLSVEEQQRVYSNAFVDALTSAKNTHPALESALIANFGQDWQATLQQAVDDPATFVLNGGKFDDAGLYDAVTKDRQENPGRKQDKQRYTAPRPGAAAPEPDYEYEPS